MTATLSPEARRSVALFTSGAMTDIRPRLSFKKNDEGRSVLSVADLPVFRSGTFRDSMGFQHTWEALHIAQMVSNYEFLASSKIFVDIPVRKGHGSFLGDPMDTLIGYHTGLRSEPRTAPHDGKEYTYLLASFEVFDEEAQGHVNEGHWRNRSSEVGFYLTNDEAEFWPVYMGFAYVDIPAVEGLNGFSKQINPTSRFSVMLEKEAPVAGENPNVKPGDTGGSAPENPSKESPDQLNTPKGPDGQGTTTTPEGAPRTTSDNSKLLAPASFKINGQDTSDSARVQAHIDALETFQRETVEQSRKGFIEDLSRNNRIAATQVDPLSEFVVSLSDDQYAKWKASYESAPVSPLFGQHGATPGDANANPSQEDQKKERISVLEETVQMHSRTMPPEAVQKTGSFKELTRLLGHEPTL